MPIFGFFDYGKSGKGIAKNEPVKKPFFMFWELFARKFWKFFYINAIYVLFCLPVVTFGPATVAMSQVMRKFTLEQPIFIFDEFWRTFKRNFKQGLIVGILDIIFILVFVNSFFTYITIAEESQGFFNLAVISVMVATGAFILMMHFYIYPQIACLSLSLKQIIRNSMLLTVYGIGRNLITLLFTILTVIVMYLFPISLVFLPVLPFAWLNFLMVFNAYPVITKHIITPFYEAKGEKNPEIPDFNEDEANEKALFEDFGGREAVIKSKPKPKGKIIK